MTNQRLHNGRGGSSLAEAARLRAAAGERRQPFLTFRWPGAAAAVVGMLIRSDDLGVVTGGGE